MPETKKKLPKKLKILPKGEKVKPVKKPVKPVKKKLPKKLNIVKKEGPKRKEDTHQITHIGGKKLNKRELKQLGAWRYMTDDQISHYIRIGQKYEEEEGLKRQARRDARVKKRQAEHKRKGTFKYN
jgi:hypothetical protein